MTKPIKTLDQLKARKHLVKSEILQHEHEFNQMYNNFTHPFRAVKETFFGDSKKSTTKQAEKLNRILNAVTIGVKVYGIVKSLSTNGKK